MAKIYIVPHDESPHNTVLGVFATLEEAAEFGNEVQDQFVDGVIFSAFDIGYRFDRGTGHVTYEPNLDALLNSR